MKTLLTSVFTGIICAWAFGTLGYNTGRDTDWYKPIAWSYACGYLAALHTIAEQRGITAIPEDNKCILIRKVAEEAGFNKL